MAAWFFRHDRTLESEMAARFASSRHPIILRLSRDHGTRTESILLLTLVKIAIVLDASDPQALHARTIDRALP